MSPNDPVELQMVGDYLLRSQNELEISFWLGSATEVPALCVPEGFEERSLGVLDRLAHAGIQVPQVVLGRYIDDHDVNLRYRPDFERLAQVVAPGKWSVIENRGDGRWVNDALAVISSERVIVDITGLSNKGLFGALDAMRKDARELYVGYSEAAEYSPTEQEWRRLEDHIAASGGDVSTLAQMADRQEWLYVGEHRVEHVSGHEGYDVAGATALLAFLPYKSARLASIMCRHDYTEYCFIAGEPRLARNAWRLEALRRINASIVKQWPVIIMSTFGYRLAIEQLGEALFSENGLLHRCDVHMAPMGSKMQTVASWVVSCIGQAATVLTAVPNRYYPNAFSRGIGNSWVFKFVRP
jgi:hypothetical protein